MEPASFKAYPTGAVIVREGGSASKEMVLILKGNAAVFKNYQKNNEEQLRVIGQGSFHGELSLFLGKEQAETLVALTDVLVMAVDRRGLKDFFRAQPEQAIAVVQAICRQMDDASEQLAKLRQAGAKQAPSRKSRLFPEGHGSYTLPLTNDNTEYLYQAKVTCPLCGHIFENLMVLQSKLRLLKTEPDLRSRYLDIEPMYYDVVTCPNCFYSATAAAFPEPSKRFAGSVNQVAGPYKLEMYLRTGLQRDTFTVFAGYYLALLCAPIVFDKYHPVTGNLWLRLSRLYQDSGDETMHRHASEKALADYLYAYENINFQEKQLQRITYLIGELYFQAGKIDDARNFFFKAKSNKQGVKPIQLQADNRLEEIRALKKAEKAVQAEA